MIATLVSTLLFMLPVVFGGNDVADIKGPGRMEATPGEYPYLVFIINRRSKDLITSGVLIRPRVVLTIGYNYLSYSHRDIIVVLGTHDRSQKEATRQEIRVSRIEINPELIKTINKGATGDLALLKLAEEPTFGPRVKTLGLDGIVSSGEDDEDDYSDDSSDSEDDDDSSDDSSDSEDDDEYDDEDLSSCYVAGYGLIEWDAYLQRWPRTLQKYQPEMRKPSLCEAITGDSSYARKKWLCSINSDLTGTCMFDGGDPLICEKDGKKKLYGVTSGGSRYCNLGFSYYTRLSTYYKWIKKVATALQKED